MPCVCCLVLCYLLSDALSVVFPPSQKERAGLCARQTTSAHNCKKHLFVLLKYLNIHITLVFSSVLSAHLTCFCRASFI